MQLSPFYEQVLNAVFEVDPAYGLSLGGAYALRAHGLTERPSRGLDFVTVSETPIHDIADQVAEQLRSYGLAATARPETPLHARIVVTDPITELPCPLNLLKAPLQQPPVTIDDHPVAALDDLVGMKVAALYNRSLPRDLVDVAAVADRYSFEELESLGAIFQEDLSERELALELETALGYDEEVFAPYGLPPDKIAEARRFILLWYEDLSMRIAEDTEVDPFD